MENIDTNARCESSEDYLESKSQGEEFEPYSTYPATLRQSAWGMNNLCKSHPHLPFARPIDGDALAREAAKELRARLHSIVVTPRGRGVFDIV